MFTLNSGRHDAQASMIWNRNAEQALAHCHRTANLASAGAPAKPVLVHIHAFYPVLLKELLEALAQNWPGNRPSILITVPADGDGERLRACQQVFNGVFGAAPPPCHWLKVDNRGRNLKPFLEVLHQLTAQQHPPLLLHLHTKQTLDPEGIGNAWRQDLLQKLLGSSEQIQTALSQLNDPAVGLVMPCRYAGIESRYHWGGNFALASALAPRLFAGRELHADQPLIFPAGLMFWCRPEALRAWLALPLDQTHFPQEPLGTNGTVPHALERLVCHTVEAAGYTWRLLDSPAHQDKPATTAHTGGQDAQSVWRRQSASYQDLLNQQLRDQQAKLEAEQQQSRALALELHRAQRQFRRHHLPWRRMPIRVALVLQRAGKGYISSAHLRLLEPLRLLEQQGHCQLQIVDTPQVQQLGGTERVIAQRGALADVATAAKLQDLCKQLKLPLIVDIDDALFCLPANHAEQRQYQVLSAATDRLLAHCDHAIFSTSVLAAAYHKHLGESGFRLKRSSVVANGLSPKLWLPEQQGLPARAPLPAGQPVHILYMGSVTHDDDFAMLLPQLDELEAQQPGRFHLHLIGALGNPPERPWLKIRPVPLQARRYPEFVRWLLQRRPYHFGIAPLRDNAFNAAKSDVKVLDYAALGLGSLCSVGPAYNHLIRRGLAMGTSNDQWQHALDLLMQDPQPIQRCGRRAERHLWRHRSCARVARELWQVLQVHR